MAEGKGKKYEKYDSYYNELVGETFRGTYIKTLSRDDYEIYGDPKARRWKMVKFDKRTFKKKMKEGLEHILEECEGKIWKGVHRGIFYVNPDTVQPDLFVEGTKKKYRIESFDSFDFSDNPKTNEKYSDKCGYFYTLTAARD